MRSNKKILSYKLTFHQIEFELSVIIIEFTLQFIQFSVFFRITFLPIPRAYFFIFFLKVIEKFR